MNPTGGSSQCVYVCMCVLEKEQNNRVSWALRVPQWESEESVSIEVFSAHT